MWLQSSWEQCDKLRLLTLLIPPMPSAVRVRVHQATYAGNVPLVCDAEHVNNATTVVCRKQSFRQQGEI